MDLHLTPRQLVGTIVMDEISRLPGKRKMDQAIELSGLSRSTLYNVRDGKETVTPETLRALEGAFGLPTRFFDLVIACDAERIKALPGRGVDPVRGLPEDLRHHVLNTLADMQQPRARRASDRRKRG